MKNIEKKYGATPLKKISMIDFEEFVKCRLRKDFVELLKSHDDKFFVEVKTDALGAEPKYIFSEYGCSAKADLFKGNAIGYGEKWREFVFEKLSKLDKSAAVKYIENAPKVCKKELKEKFGEEVCKFKRQLGSEKE